MRRHPFLVFISCLVLAPSLAWAQALETAAPESVGLSGPRLARMVDALRAEAAKGEVPGAVVLVARRGKIALFEAVGVLDPDKKTPMTRDAIFRLYSMSKPVTSVAALLLIEQGRMALSDPVAKYIPQFKDVKVGVEKLDAAGQKVLELVPAQRPMTIQDLMRQTSGLTYGFFGDTLVKKAYLAANLGEGDFDNAELADRLAKMPLGYQPGTTWDYSQSTDVLGRVIEVVSGKSLLAFEREALLEPLGMTDTTFYVTDAAKQARIAEPFANERVLGAGAQMGDPRIARKYESGGGGMMGTAADYANFLHMLLSGGTFGGKRIMSPHTIATMTSDQISTIITRGPYDLIGPGHTFGLGVAVRKEQGIPAFAGTPGDYYWGGVAGTTFWVDPKEKMFAILMIQSPPKRGYFRTLVRNMTYAALID